MAIVDEKYVLLTTFRKRGDPVPSPVWIVGLPDGTAGFTTEDESGKVKRIRNNSKVTLQACSMRGAAKVDSPVVEGTAEVVRGAEADVVRAAIRRKYSVMTQLFKVGALWRKLRRKPEPAVCAIRLTFG